VVAWAGAELAADNPAVTTGPLAELASRYPLVESLTAALMRAQHALGRSADALAEYNRLRTRLAEELGTDPGPELQARYRTMLRGEQAPVRAASPGIPGGRRGRTRPVARGRARVRRPRRPAGSPRRAADAAGAGPDRGRDLRGLRYRRSRQVHPGGAVGAPGGRSLPGRAALRQPARVRPGRAGDGRDRGGSSIPGGPRRRAAADPGRPGRPGRPVPQPARDPADADRARQHAGHRAGPPAAARRTDLPGPGHQPQPAHRPDRHRRRPPHPVGPALGGGGAGTAGTAPRRGPDSRRTRGGRRDPRPLCPPAARAGAGGRARRHPPPGRAGRARPRAARHRAAMADAHRRRSHDRRAQRLLLVVRGAHPRRGAAVPAARAAPRPGHHRAGRRTPPAGTPSTTCCAPTPPT